MSSPSRTVLKEQLDEHYSLVRSCIDQGLEIGGHPQLYNSITNLQQEGSLMGVTIPQMKLTYSGMQKIHASSVWCPGLCHALSNTSTIQVFFPTKHLLISERGVLYFFLLAKKSSIMISTMRFLCQFPEATVALRAWSERFPPCQSIDASECSP